MKSSPWNRANLLCSKHSQLIYSGFHKYTMKSAYVIWIHLMVFICLLLFKNLGNTIASYTAQRCHVLGNDDHVTSNSNGLFCNIEDLSGWTMSTLCPEGNWDVYEVTVFWSCSLEHSPDFTYDAWRVLLLRKTIRKTYCLWRISHCSCPHSITWCLLSLITSDTRADVLPEAES